MKYVLNKYEMQEIDDVTILFLLDDNDNILLDQCIALEGTGKIFMESLSNYNNINDAEQMLFEIFQDTDINIIRKDLNDFINKLIGLNLLYWSNDNE